MRRHAIDDTRFPRHPTHSLSIRPAHPHGGAALTSVAEEESTLQQLTHATWPQQHRFHTWTCQHTASGKRTQIRPNPHEAGGDKCTCGTCFWPRGRPILSTFSLLLVDGGALPNLRHAGLGDLVAYIAEAVRVVHLQARPEKNNPGKR